jgi:hypothetical protein
MVIRTSFGAGRAHEYSADARKMQKPNQGSEKKRLTPETGVLRSMLWRYASLNGYFRTKMGWLMGAVHAFAPT